MSASYLNEIEKGKKYPKAEKIYALANALELEYDDLVSLKLKQDLAPLGDLLNSRFFDQVPFELFGMEGSQIIELLAKSPAQASAFLGAFMEVARHYNISEKEFHAAALRSYQEIANNYFPEIEKKAAAFLQKHTLNPQANDFLQTLEALLLSEYGYTIDRKALQENSLLHGVKSFYTASSTTLYLEASLSDNQQLFLIAKELGFNILGLDKAHRVNTIGGRIDISSFDQLLINFQASYFAGAILLPEKAMVVEIGNWLNIPTWDAHFLVDLSKRWNATPETLFHRFTNLLPQHYGLDTLFFLKFNQSGAQAPVLERELHLNKKHLPHANNLGAHYCGRWVALQVLRKLTGGKKTGLDTQVQFSNYPGGEKYLVVAMGRSLASGEQRATSACLGISVNNKSKRKIAWIQDPQIQTREVNVLCENCGIENCEERSAAPSILQGKQQRAEIRKALHALE